MQTLCLGQIQHSTSLRNCLLIFQHGGGCIMIWLCLTLAKTGEFFWIKINGTERSTGKMLVENLLQSALHQTLENELTFQQDNKLQHKDKSTVELFTKNSVHVPEQPSYSFDLSLLDSL
jgi:hypothetical protein